MDNPDIIEPFLKSKLVKELESKRGNVLSVYHFILVPVIWGGHDDLKKLHDFLQKKFFKYSRQN